MVASIGSTTLQIAPKNSTFQIRDTNVGHVNDSGSVSSILSGTLAKAVIKKASLVLLTNAPAKDIKIVANEPIPVINVMQTSVASNDWWVEDAEFVVVCDGLQSLIGRNWFDALVKSVTQTPKPNEGSLINNITTQ